MNAASLTPVNHHADFPGFAGLTGLLAGLIMIVGRGGVARLAADLASVLRGDHVVDVGCGPGTAAREGAIERQVRPGATGLASHGWTNRQAGSDWVCRCTSAAVLDAPGPRWRQTVRQQIAELDDLIAQVQAAQMFLTHALDCPSEHPARECPTMIAALDRLVDGATVEQLVAEHRRGDQRDAAPEG